MITKRSTVDPAWLHESAVLPDSPGMLLVCRAIWELIAFDVITLTTGFKGVYKPLRRLKTRCTQALDEEAAIARAKAAIAHACLYYPKTAACLQRSVALVRLLRRNGIPAELVIGVQQLPFRSHAWAEYKGVVLNDGQKAPEVYTPIDRV